MKKFLACLLMAVMVVSMVGCGKNGNAGDGLSVVEEDANESFTDASELPETVGSALSAVFAEEMEKGSDMETTVNALMAVSRQDCATMEVSEGYLNGFTEEIKGFNSGTMFSPIIGSIPFVGYVFETDDTAALKELLEMQADPAWNLCTEAEEIVSETYGNYVFFAMVPGEDFE